MHTDSAGTPDSHVDERDSGRRPIGSRLRRAGLIALVGGGVLGVALLAYSIYTFSIFHGRDINYPQVVLSGFGQPGGSVAPGVEGAEATQNCEPSRTVEMQIWLIDYMVNKNAWVPAHPLYKIGFFGVVDFEHTPFFDNKAAEQIGVLDVTRRVGIELTDSLGRERGTSAVNADLEDAQSALRVNATAWYINNPFSERINTVSVSADASYRRSIDLYRSYNESLAACDALFDARTDNLREALSRITATLGATTAELGARSQAVVYDPETDLFVEGDGNNRGWFDFRADDMFHRARGKMFALHGLLQGMREDFHQVLKDRQLGPIWDRMERYVAEAAVMDPLLVSNGPPDSVVQPAHLEMIAEKILRARTNMVEIRDILKN